MRIAAQRDAIDIPAMVDGGYEELVKHRRLIGAARLATGRGFVNPPSTCCKPPLHEYSKTRDHRRPPLVSLAVNDRHRTKSCSRGSTTQRNTPRSLWTTHGSAGKLALSPHKGSSLTSG